MQVAKSVNKGSRLQPTNLRRHQREERVRSDVERHSEKKVRASLIELAAQLAFLHEELEQRVTRRQRHLFDLSDVPRADNQPAAVGILLNLFDDMIDLMDGVAIGRAPV